MSDQAALPLLVAKGIGKTFLHPRRTDILREVDLTVYPGESIAIIGRSGEGKSTLLHILGSLDTPSMGDVMIDGELVSNKNKLRLRRDKLGFIFQSFFLLEDYTVRQNACMPAWISRQDTRPGTAVGNYVDELLMSVGLGERANHPVSLLSGGEKQRLALVRALCNHPLIMFADEPSGNLDRSTAFEVHKILLQFPSTLRRALILVTHDLELAASCSRILELREGRLIPKDKADL